MLKINGLFAGYGDRVAIKNIDATFQKGKLISVIGPNGSGKSTLLKAISGIIPIMNGEVVLDDMPLSGFTTKERAQKIAYLPQGKNTPDMTVGRMVLHGRFPHIGYPRQYSKRDRAIALEAMRRTGVEALADTPLHELSGGMRQNAYIAMALAQDTDYILLDEPTTYLDIKNQLGLIKNLRQLTDGGKGIVAVMHDLPLAFTYSDEVIVINEGCLAACGTPQEVRSSGIISDIFGVQLKSDFSYNLK